MLTFIPKKTGASVIQDFRPISLISGLAKVTSNCIRKVLHEAIDGNQYAFVKDQNNGRILIANESVEDYRQQRKKGMVLKLDLEKAYENTYLNLII